MEEWKEFDRYKISSYGRVIGLNGTILKPYLHNTGYLSYCHRLQWPKRKTVAIHRVVALLFVNNPDNKPEVNHINGIKTDNHYSNLEWCTSSENQTHALRNGLQKAKLDMLSANVIRSIYSEKKLNQRQLSEYFQVDNSVISDIVNNKIYKDGSI